jgi:hypothetical protein
MLLFGVRTREVDLTRCKILLLSSRSGCQSVRPAT